MNTDNVKQLCEEALRRPATALEQGQSDALKTYLAMADSANTPGATFC